MVEEGADDRGIEVIDVQLRWLLVLLRRREDQQQPQGVAIGGPRVRAGLTLTD